jgi:alanine racemase
MPRPIRAIIHQNALAHNLNIARKHASQQGLCSSKANAYGHGIERVYPAFKTADGFALLDIDEAKRYVHWAGQGQFCCSKAFFQRRICLTVQLTNSV